MGDRTRDEAASGADSDVFGRSCGSSACSLPADVLAQPGILDKVLELGAAGRATPARWDRAAELLALVDG